MYRIGDIILSKYDFIGKIIKFHGYNSFLVEIIKCFTSGYGWEDINIGSGKYWYIHKGEIKRKVKSVFEMDTE